jgi:hypothetical protein
MSKGSNSRDVRATQRSRLGHHRAANLCSPHRSSSLSSATGHYLPPVDLPHELTPPGTEGLHGIPIGRWAARCGSAAATGRPNPRGYADNPVLTPKKYRLVLTED